ncbi:DEAD/DEAH box helicase [Bacillus sp. OK048]|uniref:DEAD/DEAH box helicase n=1 Tax=Bacillus sp. OK048 TaxID=1882761 RepID=UPI000885576E|nr:DEAD/DEAH box helicase [Bacillus sp. OK048]SDN26238.1 Superfamily II DNA or RNA helicase, SNF2 family [Bacillus sp. OK048]
MNIALSHKQIKEMCGTVSFKRGDSFYRAGKVAFDFYSRNRCEATVRGAEDFYVTVIEEEDGSLFTKCSCPKLLSVKTECQHIAAVLLALNDHQQQGTTPIVANQVAIDSTTKQELTKGLLTIFTDQPKRSSGHQLHFENRQVLEATFLCKPVEIAKGTVLLGIEMEIDYVKVKNIRDFLVRVNEGHSSILADTFTFNPTQHCFQNETNAVIQQLIQVGHDEQAYVSAMLDPIANTFTSDQLLVPPSSWEQLHPLLVKAPVVKVENEGETFAGLVLKEEILPLKFVFATSGNGGFQLRVKGLTHLIVLAPYHFVLYKSKFIRMDETNCKRLAELKNMLADSKTNQIEIPSDQIDYFLEKVVPGLKKLGEVELPRNLRERYRKTPLIAKLYLDRVKNKLLAGLEFQYENIVINPLDSRERQNAPYLIRDEEKENQILQLMEESSFAHTDSGYFLHNEELEYEFLYHTVPKLQKLVQIYATTAVRNRIFRENTIPKIRIKVKKERTNWLEFKFEMDGIPEKQIKDVLAALEVKRKYYRLRNGTLLSLETREFEEIKRFLQAVPVQAEDLEAGFNAPILKGIQLMDSVEDHTTFTLEDSFRQFLDTISNPSSMEFEVPELVASILRDYQVHGYKWMKTIASYGFGGILADDMGLGKTLQSITFILSVLPSVRKSKLPILIVCPSSLTYNWLSEIKKFAPVLRAVIIDGSTIERKAKQKESVESDVVITSYPLLRKDIEWYVKQSYHTVFFDEAQAFKNPVTQTARAVKRIQADHRFALTGTPVENSLEELWSIYHVVFPELFQGLKEYSHLTRKTIARRIRPFLLRRLKEDVLSELPEKIESVDSVELLPEQKKLYGAFLAKLRHDTLKHLDKDTLRKNKIKILAGLTRLRQICCHPALFVDGYKGSSAKFEQLLRIIEESRHAGRRVLIFSQFTKMLQLIGRELALEGLPFFYLDGQTPSEERVELTNRFNAGERDFFLISLKAGGTGLNLTGADTVILYDLWWNPAVEEQAADRAHRMGQKNIVQVIKLVARGTIEEKMNELQEKKRDLIEEIIESKDKGKSSLTEEDIREILMI